MSVENIKAMRVEIDGLFQKVMDSKSRTETITPGFNFDLYVMAEGAVFLKLKEAKMWLGVLLEAMNLPFPKELADKAEAK